MSPALQREPLIPEMDVRALKSIIASLNPMGRYGDKVAQAKAELETRGVDYSDCL